MPSSSGWKLSAVALWFLSGSACKEDTAELVVELAGGASASPDYFHGNCFAGWSVRVDLRARETGRVEVVLDSLSYRLVDSGTAQEIGADVLDRQAIETRYGTMASVLPGGSAMVYRVSGHPGGRPSGAPIQVTGSLSGRDENGRSVSTSFDLSGPVSIDDVPPPTSGACSPP